MVKPVLREGKRYFVSNYDTNVCDGETQEATSHRGKRRGNGGRK